MLFLLKKKGRSGSSFYIFRILYRPGIHSFTTSKILMSAAGRGIRDVLAMGRLAVQASVLTPRGVRAWVGVTGEGEGSLEKCTQWEVGMAGVGGGNGDNCT